MAIVTFVGAADPEETERSMQIMWQLLHPKLGSNVSLASDSQKYEIDVIFSLTFSSVRLVIVNGVDVFGH